jgi:hypothetical protein
MSSEELLTLLVTFASGSVATALVGPPIKESFERRTLRKEQKKSRWAPLRSAARKLEQRFENLTSIYLTQPPTEPWNGHKWDPKSNSDNRLLPSKARDFCELYMLDQNAQPIRNWYDERPSPIAVRNDPVKVDMMWIRLHEMTYAASSLHMTAEYLAYAERTREELQDGRLILSNGIRKRMNDLLLDVRQQLHGTSKDHPAAGVIFEHQELIGQNMWKDNEKVIDLWEFYGKLLSREWAQFTDLFRFFIDFHLKLETEVANTKKALRQLWSGIETTFPELRQ